MATAKDQNAKLVIHGPFAYERPPETVALLKILTLAKKQVEEGKGVPARDAIR